jgi:hypothetical protein
MEELKVAFNLVLDGPLLRIVYRVHNESSGRVCLIDQLVEPRPEGLVLSRRPVILQGEPGVVRFVLGWVPPFGKTMFLYPPGGRIMDPGGELSGAIEAPWPLVAHHNFSTAPPLTPPHREAVLEVGVLPEPARWGQMRLVTGDHLAAPDLSVVASGQVSVRSAPCPLPEPISNRVGSEIS